ncbi:hypothetical protein AB6A40_007940 [Gnathostoma spinigerum]|uniref:SURF1-like protein n=1 Tax=Gnathostoma spinigerum TaxID=75299 RepID=A0ABD6EN69_9BILA
MMSFPFRKLYFVSNANFSLGGVIRLFYVRNLSDISSKSHRNGYENGTIIKLSARNDKSNKREKKKKIDWSVGSVAMMVVPATAFCLGCWQIRRLRWKLGLLAEMDSRLNLPAVSLPEDLSCLNDLEYRRVRITGEFLHDREFLIQPRGRVDKEFVDNNIGFVASSDITSHGAHVITPFRLSDSGRVVMVNRGWVPHSKIDPSTRQSSQPKGLVTLEAIVRKSEKRPPFVSHNIPETNTWYYRDFEAMGQRNGTEPVFLEAVAECTVPDGPLGGQTRVNLRNDHLSYALTWYSLAVATLAMWVIKFRR